MSATESQPIGLSTESTEAEGTQAVRGGAEDAVEQLGEAQDALTPAQFCEAAVWAGVALGCAAAVLACSGTTYVTIGGTAYPCTLVVGGACAASPAAARAYIVAACGR